MPDLTLWGFFVLASLLLLLTPGPAVLFIVARSVQQGRIAGLVSVIGIHLGTTVHIMAAALGISALLVSSAFAFAVVKYLGAAYLIWMGLRTLLSKDINVSAEALKVEAKSLRRAFRDGFVVNLFNPKTAVFFAAFLPQFFTAEQPFLAQSVVLGTIFVLIAAVSDSGYALAASAIAGWLTGRRRLGHVGAWLGGVTYVGLGVATALIGERGSS